jgi:O-antigen/teichoic acid export membrane protein
MTPEFMRQSALYFLARITPGVLAIPALAFYTRSLAPSEYGIYITVIATVTISHSIILSWLWTSTLRLFHLDDAGGSFRIALLFCFSAVGLFGLLLTAGGLVFLPEFRVLIALTYATFLAVGWLELSLSILRARVEVPTFLRASVTRSVLTTSIGVVFVLAGLGAEGLVAATALGAAIPAGFLLARDWRGLRIRRSDPNSFRELLRFGAPLAVGFSAEAVSVSADRLVLGFLRDAAAVGQYGASYGISYRLVSVAIDPIGIAGFSLAVRALEQQGKDAAAAQMTRNLLFQLMLGVPFVIGAVLVTPQLVAILIGPPFRDMALVLTPILLVSCFLILLRNHFCEALFQLAKQTRPYAYTIIGIALIALTSLVLLTPKYGAVGVAYAMLITHSIAFAVTAYFGLRLFPIRVPYRELGKIALSAALMAAAVDLIPPDGGLESLLIKAVVGAITYGIGLLALNFEDARPTVLALIRNSVPKASRRRKS